MFGWSLRNSFRLCNGHSKVLFFNLHSEVSKRNVTCNLKCPCRLDKDFRSLEPLWLAMLVSECILGMDRNAINSLLTIDLKTSCLIDCRFLVSYYLIVENGL